MFNCIECTIAGGPMDAIPFAFPSAAVPFVVAEGHVEGVAAPVRVLFDTGNATPFTVLVGARSAAAAQTSATGAAPLVFNGVAGGGPATVSPATLKAFRLGPIALSNISAGV